MKPDSITPPAGATAFTKTADASLIEAWDRAQAAREIYDSEPAGQDLDRDYTTNELAQLDIIDAAERHIRDTIATTPRGVEIKLWIALQHSITCPMTERAVKVGDFEGLERNWGDLDLIDQLMHSSIKSLRAIGGAA